jgi:hypothetical protein
LKKKFWTLEIGLLLQGISLGLFALIYETPFGSFLFLNMDFSERFSFGLDNILGVVLIVVSIGSLFWKHFMIFLYMAVCFFMVALFQTIIGGIPHSNLTLFAHSARYLSPLAFYLLLGGSKKGLILLRLGISITFFTHGIEAFLMEPSFIDYLISALKGFSLNETGARYILMAIGGMDILLAISSLLLNIPWIYFYMGFWGLITASYRVVFEGDPGVLSMLVRSGHFMVPLFLGIYGLKRSLRTNQGSL